MKVRPLGDAGRQKELRLPHGKDVSNTESAPGKKKTKKNRDNNPLNKIFQPTEKQETTAEVTGA